MYLAHKIINGMAHYFIRESYRDGDLFNNRDLFDLGPNPAAYIIYPGGNSFYIDEVVEEALSSAGCEPSHAEMDELFWGFLKPRIKRKLASFHHRETTYRKSRQDFSEDPATAYHIFDKRRLYFIRTGRAQPDGRRRVPPRFFNMLYNKSRDEIEQKFIRMESILRSHEYKSYVYAIFDVRKFFTESFAGRIPHFLDQRKIDEYFLKEICRLNDDAVFWAGMEKDRRLHEYLVRYMIMFFDFGFEPRNFMQAYFRRFVNSRRDYRPPSRGYTVSLEEAGNIFHSDTSDLKQMSRRELARLYRRRALKLHPDRGGGHDEFVKLTEAYHSLLRRKPK